MSTPTPTYVRFPVRSAASRGGFGLSPFRYSLWLAPDHLLLLARAGFFIAFHETYKRFYFGDIRGIGIEWTNAWKIKLWIFGGLAALGLVSGLITMLSGAIGWSIFFAVCMVVGLTYGVIVYRGGPSCIVRVHTAVQEEEIPCLNTEVKAHKFLSVLQPKIEEVQGPMPAASAINAVPLHEPAAVPPTVEEQRSQSPVIHLILFGSLLAMSLMETMMIVFPQSLLWMLVGVCAAAVAILTIAAIVRQTGNPAYAPGLKTTVWLLVVMQILASIGAYFFLIYISINESIENPGMRPNPWAGIGHHFKVMAANPWFVKFILAQVVIVSVLAIVGGAMAWGQYKRASERTASLPTP